MRVFIYAGLYIWRVVYQILGQKKFVFCFVFLFSYFCLFFCFLIFLFISGVSYALTSRLLLLVIEHGLRHAVIDAVLRGLEHALPLSAATISALQPDLVVAVAQVLLALVRPRVDHAVGGARPAFCCGLCLWRGLRGRCRCRCLRYHFCGNWLCGHHDRRNRLHGHCCLLRSSLRLLLCLLLGRLRLLLRLLLGLLGLLLLLLRGLLGLRLSGLGGLLGLRFCGLLRYRLANDDLLLAVRVTRRRGGRVVNVRPLELLVQRVVRSRLLLGRPPLL